MQSSKHFPQNVVDVCIDLGSLRASRGEHSESIELFTVAAEAAEEVGSLVHILFYLCKF
jgi:hypothetical protein